MVLAHRDIPLSVIGHLRIPAAPELQSREPYIPETASVSQIHLAPRFTSPFPASESYLAKVMSSISRNQIGFFSTVSTATAE